MWCNFLVRNTVYRGHTIDPRILGRMIASMEEMPDLEQFMDVME
jgi:hypothetical protein